MTSASVHELPKAGFQFILDDIVESIQQVGLLRHAVHEILSLGKRIEVQHALACLTAEQTALLELGHYLPLLDVPIPESHDANTTYYYLGVWNYGRIWLSANAPANPDCRLIACVAITEAMRSTLATRAEQIKQSMQSNDGEMDAFFADCSDEKLREVLFEVHECVDHTDPVLLYIGDDTISNFGKFNNLQARNGASLPDCFFNRVKEMHLQDWTRAERILVFCLYHLRLAGCRGEEFNCKQLHPAAVSTYIDQRLQDYRRLVPALVNERASTIPEKALLLARYKQETAKDILTYRWVNGLNFYKEERLCERKPLLPNVATLPVDIKNWIAHRLGIQADAYENLNLLFAACVLRMANVDFASNAPDMHVFEELLQVIVESAIAASHSDVGMTRGFRDILKWQAAFANQSYDEICHWPSADYYCAVFPSKAMFERFKHTPDTLIKILYACSGRMQFNSWHYTPGHCPRESVPADRHFYLPPRMPDTAIWSDQHHAGHVLAAVRNTIRSPAPINIDGRVFPGLVDLRLYRQQGEAYTDAELFNAISFTEYLRCAYQAWVDYQINAKRTVRIDAFDKDWFRQRYTTLCAKASTGESTQKSDFHRVTTATSTTAPNAMSALFGILYQHAHVEQTSTKIALIEALHAQQEYAESYRDLIAKTIALRQTLSHHHVNMGDCVALFSRRPLHQALGIIAGLANAVTIHPINPALSATMLEGQLLHARPTLIIVDDDIELPENVRNTTCIRWSAVFSDVLAYDDVAAAAALANVNSIADDHAGLLIYTSGTTGDPKGVRLGWHEISSNVTYAISALGYEPAWIAGSMLPRFHTFTLISDLFPALFLGGRIILVDTFELPHAKSIVDAFQRHNVQSYSAAPIILEACCGLRAWNNVPSLRFAVAGAAPLKEKTRLAYLATFGHPIIPCYGLSETTCFATISPREEIRAGSAGRPAGIEICVFDEHGTKLEPNQSGELAMRGPSVIRNNYFRDHEGKFAKAFTSDGWFLSGDIGHIDMDGFVYVTGRKKNMVIRGGEKIYLEDLDRCLFEDLDIVDCASIVYCEQGKPDEAWTFIVTADSQIVPRDEIATLVRTVLTPRHMPDRIFFIERVPRTLSGKASLRDLLAIGHSLKTERTQQ